MQEQGFGELSRVVAQMLLHRKRQTKILVTVGLTGKAITAQMEKIDVHFRMWMPFSSP